MTFNLDNQIITTDGTCSRVVCGLFEIEGGVETFTNIIRNKRVLLLGAGIPIVALQAYSHLGYNDPTCIISMDARYGTNLHDMQPRLDQALKQYPLEIQERVKEQLLTANWNDPAFADNLKPFDYILATGSYLYYSNTYTEESMRTILATLAPGGEFRAEAPYWGVINQQLLNARDFVNSIPGYSAEIRLNENSEWVDKAANIMMPEYLYILIKRDGEI